MRLYIMRHAAAVEAEDWSGPDATRPLTDEGRERTRAVLEHLRRKRKMAVAAILTSPLMRARQTAEVAARVFGPRAATCRTLAERPSVAALAKRVLRAGAPVLLVGHEPDCGALVAELTGRPGTTPFKKAGVACLEGAFAAGEMRLCWQTRPGDAR